MNNNQGSEGFREEVEALVMVPGDSVVKNPSAMQKTQETQVPSLVWEDPPVEGNGNPLKYSCLEISIDRRD